MRRWERNGCAVHTELPFRFSVIYNDDFVEIVIYKIVAKGNDVFDIYFNTKEPEHSRWQTTGNIYRPGTFPIGGSTNRGGQ